MKGIIIREAKSEDVPVLKEMEQGVIRAERPYDPTIRPDPVTYYDLDEMVASDDYYLVVAEKEGRILSSGYAAVRQARPYLDHRQYALLGFMFTLPNYRGQGINGRIIGELKKWAKTRGLKEIRLTVYVDNDPAIKAYEKQGFKKHLIEMRLV